LRLLEARDRRDAERRFGRVWEANEIERDRALNDDFVALDLVPELSCGEGPWRNLVIEGDNFDALRHLRMTHAGRVKCIYIDPPYNTGNSDFVYNDSFVDREDAWRHSKWCEFMYQRLKLARHLLREDGAIFVSIDDNEVAPLRLMMDSVFSPSNYIATLVWEKGKKGDSKFFSVAHEYMLVYANNKAFQLDQGVVWRRRKAGVDTVLAYYEKLRAAHEQNHAQIRVSMMKWYRSLPKTDPAKQHKHYCWSDDRGLYFPDNFHGPDDGRESRPRYDILHPVTGKSCKKPSTGWRWEEERTKRALAEVPPRIHFGPDESTIPCRKSYLSEVDAEPMPSVFYKDGRAATLEVEAVLGKGAFSFPKDSAVLADILRLCVGPDDIVLDFFAGSGTTGHAVQKLNAEDGGRRRFILVSSTEATTDEPEKNLCRDVCAERLRRVMQGYTGRDGSGVSGIGGDFAYLRTHRVPQRELLALDHAQVWAALQLIHCETLTPYAKVPFLWAGDEDSAVVYVPRFDKRIVETLRQRCASAGEVVLYSWQPQTLRQHLRSSHISHLPVADTLTRRFRLNLELNAPRP